jgi:hypothetical protein
MTSIMVTPFENGTAIIVITRQDRNRVYRVSNERAGRVMLSIMHVISVCGGQRWTVSSPTLLSGSVQFTKKR